MANKVREARSKQTPETLEKICEALRAGIPISRSAKAAGVSYQTVCNWRNAGWEAIDTEAEDSDAPISFVARFAIEVEAALVHFMAPFLARIRDEAKGVGKGDWRAARAILEMRFPDEFSEKVAAAKSGKLEVSGQIAMEHQHGYREFLNLRNMTGGELALEMERLESQVDHTPISGTDLDAQIGILEGKLDSMREAAARGHGWVAANWLVVGEPAIRPAVPTVIDLNESEHRELLAVSSPLTDEDLTL